MKQNEKKNDGLFQYLDLMFLRTAGKYASKAESLIINIQNKNVKAFGLKWKDCETIMEKPGFTIEVKALAVA